MRNKRGITLISLVITIVVLIILSSVGIYFALGNNGILNKAKEAKNETLKQAATEKMNLKITNIQIETYGEEQRMPTLQEFADGLCEDEEIQYVQLQSKKVGSLDKVEVGNASSIFTKLKEYPYEFEINSSLQLASIDGIQVANETNTDIENLKQSILEIKSSETIVDCISCTTTNTWEKICDYPEGYNKNNTFITSFKILYNEGWNIRFLDTYFFLDDDGIYMYSTDSVRINKNMKIYLKK